jgi:hypothetical protein
LPLRSRRIDAAIRYELIHALFQHRQRDGSEGQDGVVETPLIEQAM